MLCLKSIKHSFGSKTIFEDVHLNFEPGKIYGIVGANGVGKTTLFRVLAQQYRLQFGSISWNDAPLSRQHISFLPTDPYFYPYMNGEEYLSIVLKHSEQIAKAKVMSASLNLNLDQIVDTYSTGMKKKLAFIGIYIQNRSISIYDEPFNGVDLESNELLCSYLQKKREEKVTLLSSHILSMLNDVCDEILHIEEGYHITRYQPDQYGELKKHIKSRLVLD